MKKVAPRNQRSGNRQSQSSQSNRQNNTQNSKKGRAATVAVQELSKKWMIPLVIVLAVIPLIVSLHVYKTELSEYPWFSIHDTYGDVFLYYKSFFLRLVGAIILFIMAYLLTKKDRSFLKKKGTVTPLVAVGVFGLFSLASALFSEHATDAFFGGYQQFEGCFVLLVYVICFFFAFGYARTTKLIRFLLTALLIGAALIGFLGTLQYFGIDWGSSETIKKLLSWEKLFRPELSNMELTSTGITGTSYATLYNPNYVGSYVAIVIPYCVYLIIFGERLWRRILAGITAVMLILTQLGAVSDTGLIALAVCAVIAVVLLLPYLKRTIRIAVIAAGAVAVGLVAYVFISGGGLDNLFLKDDFVPPIEYMITEDNSVFIRTSSGKNLRATMEQEKLNDTDWAAHYYLKDTLTVTDEDTGESLPLEVYEDVKLALKQDGYPALNFYNELMSVDADHSPDGTARDIGLMNLMDAETGHVWSFTTVDGALKYFDRNLGRTNDLRHVETAGFDGHYLSLSGRGYIWAHVLPLLPDYIFVGAGPDNFVYAYPNDDYVAKDYWGYTNHTTSKPHNMYLQIWVQDGLIALLALIFLYVLYMIRVIRLCYRRRSKDLNKNAEQDEQETSPDTQPAEPESPKRKLEITHLGVAITSAVSATGFMVAGLANDSTVCVTPLFWVILGIGYAATYTI